MVNEKRRILKVINMRREKWIGHIMKHNDYMVTLIHGRMDGNSGKVVPRKQFMNQLLEEVAARSYYELNK